MYNTFQTMLKKENEIKEYEGQMQSSLFELQPNLTPDMRLTLLDWLCQVSNDYCLKRETFHRAIIMVDRYMQSCGEVV
jgi:hypothetical protein